MKRSLAIICLLVMTLAACTLPSANPPDKVTAVPTQFIPPTLPVALTRLPSHTSVSPTISQTPALQPTAALQPSRTFTSTTLPATSTSTNIPATAKPSPSAGILLPTGPAPQNPEVILILAPGLNSVVTSPVVVSGEADPTFEQNLVLKITGEDGLALVTRPTTIKAELGKRGPYKVDLTFRVAKDQPGRVAAYSTSAKDGGLEHFSSVEIRLIASGQAQIARSAAASEMLVISQPARNARISGGRFTLLGWSGPVFENTLNWVLCGEGGSGKSDPFCGTVDNVLGRGVVMVQAPDVGKPGPFGIQLVYKISQPVGARLAVYFTSPRDGGLVHLASVPVRLEP